jgi:hypothetical protein
VVNRQAQPYGDVLCVSVGGCTLKAVLLALKQEYTGCFSVGDAAAPADTAAATVRTS